MSASDMQPPGGPRGEALPEPAVEALVPFPVRYHQHLHAAHASLPIQSPSPQARSDSPTEPPA